MSDVTTNAPGSFCWPELATSDSGSAKKFYGTLFGWTAEDQPAAPGQVYTMLRLGGRDVGALYADPSGNSGPPHWNTYVSVVNADESAAKAKSLGGKVILEPFDVMDKGRMAIIQDPQGAFVSVWQPKKGNGVQVAGEAHTMCWNELHTTDTARAQGFYTGLFGWNAKPGPEYTEFENGGRPHAGMMTIPREWGPVPPHWMIYFTVDDCDATVRKACELGGKALMPAMDFPNVGRFAILADGQGAAFAVIKLNSGHHEEKS